MTTLEEHAQHWDTLAAEKEVFAAYEEGRGSSGAALRASARVYRACASALRLEAATGVPHCACHQAPRKT